MKTGLMMIVLLVLAGCASSDIGDNIMAGAKNWCRNQSNCSVHED